MQSSHELRKKTPSLIAALRLRCVHCQQTPLCAEGSYLSFRPGCDRCNYRFDRGEAGYFQGAAWMINYGILGSLLLIMAVVLLNFTELSGLKIASILSVQAAFSGLLIHPFCRAIWIWLDHHLHPLEEDETLFH